jgi:mono/diheme cytochrome c family protein
MRQKSITDTKHRRFVAHYSPRNNKMRRYGIAYAQVACVMSNSVLSGCATARRREPLVAPARLDNAQQHGQLVFMQNCNKCHPGGEAGLAPAINDKPFPNFLKKFQVRHGLGAMPQFDKQKISDADLEDLMTYIAAIRRQKPSGERTGATEPADRP